MIPWKLIVFLLVFTIVVLFAGFNLGPENRTETISFIFGEVHDVPVFLSIFISFLAGAVLMLPFTIRKKVKERKPPAETLDKHEENTGKTDGKSKK